MRYAIVIAKAGDSYSACVPDLPCVAAGDKVEDTKRLLEAIYRGGQQTTSRAHDYCSLGRRRGDCKLKPKG